ncbi:MAG: hypothetical protein PHX52_01935 [Candidatus Pacebacteria bacterium]|nr:hypothetical protein [Candidatus Paceibacterota bacterium]
MVEAIIILLGLFQLILLVKIWQMTGDVRELKEKFILFTKRDLTERRKIELINEAVYKRLKDWHKVRKMSNKTNVEKTVLKAIDSDEKFIQNVFDDFLVNDFYSTDQLKEAMIDEFIRK